MGSVAARHCFRVPGTFFATRKSDFSHSRPMLEISRAVCYKALAIGCDLGQQYAEPSSSCSFTRKGRVAPTELHGLEGFRISDRTDRAVAKQRAPTRGCRREKRCAVLTSRRVDLGWGPQEQGSKVTDVWPTIRVPWKSNNPRERAETGPKPVAERGQVTPRLVLLSERN